MLCQPKLLLRIRPCLWHGRTSSTADAVLLPLATLDLRFKLHCDLRSCAEGSCALDVISLQILFVFPASYNFSPEGHNARLRAITKGGGKNVVTVALSSDALGAMSTEFAIEARPLRGRTSSVTASPCHLPLQGKASLRIEILCQHNVGRSNYRRYNNI